MGLQPKEPVSAQRIDQWLWFARIVKSRTLAQGLIERGKVRLNRVRIEKPSQTVKAGDVITIALGPRVRVFEILGLGLRRSPAPQAALLYRLVSDSQSPPATASPADPAIASAASSGVREQGAGRPTKRDRRAINRLKGLT